MKMPIESPCSSLRPQKTGSLALSAMSFEIGIDTWSPCSGPPWPKRYEPTQTAIQLSMIVEITSCAPTVALRMPATPAQTAPASVATTVARTMWSSGFISGNDEPTHTAKIAPTKYWPCPPMLNIPQRNAKATASPVRMSGVVYRRVSCRLKLAVTRSSAEIHGSR
jgi:hypothetical protein